LEKEDMDELLGHEYTEVLELIDRYPYSRPLYPIRWIVEQVH